VEHQILHQLLKHSLLPAAAAVDGYMAAVAVVVDLEQIHLSL
jgi:hypothetical protein